MKKSKLYLLAALAITSVTFVGCEKDDDEENEEELITTVKLKFTEAGTTNTTTATFRDPDGDGGAPPTLFEPIVLKANKTYNYEVELLDETKTPAEDITEEVEEEDVDHQFYYVPSAVGITVSNLNIDRRGWPLGTKATWTTSAASIGSVRVVLKHKPGQKGASDPITLGDTDIDLTFAARVEN